MRQPATSRVVVNSRIKNKGDLAVVMTAPMLKFERPGIRYADCDDRYSVLT
jgi:hypothetical protein